LSIHTLIRAQAAQNTRFHSRGAWVQLLGAYEEYRVDTWMLLCIVLFLAVACCLWDARFKEAAHAEAWAPRIPHHELAALAGFTLLPAAGMLVATLVTHAYISRYFLPAIVGLSILATTLLACLLANRLPIAYALLALIAALELFDAARIARRLTRGRPDIAILAGDRSLNLPVVFEDAKDLLYAQRNHAASARKFWYLASPEESARIQQFDTDDLAMLRLKQDTGDPQIVPLADFLSTKDAFYLYVRDGRSVGWLSEFLLRSGMRVTLQRYVPGGMLFLATK